MPDLPRSADVVIVGGGVNGASIAYHLARRGAGRVVLVEKDFLAAGPTSRSTAMVRRFYVRPEGFPLDFLNRSAARSAEIFRDWAELIGGDPGFHQIGYTILAGQAEAPDLRRSALLAQEQGAHVQLLSRCELQDLVPGMAVDDLALGSYEPESGFADPSSTTMALADRARAHGATIVQYSAASEILVHGSRVSGVRTAAGDVSAPVVVNCAGVWADRLLEPLGLAVGIRPKRHQMCVFQRPPDMGSHPAIVDLPNRTYMRPDLGDLTLHGVGSYDEVVDPDAYDEGVDPDEVVRDAELIARRLPAMENGLFRRGYSGLYDVTPDAEPVLGAIPAIDGLFACFGWSGHGFKHSPETGRALADVVLDGRCADYDIEPFRWSRFREGALLPTASPTSHASGRSAR